MRAAELHRAKHGPIAKIGTEKFDLPTRPDTEPQGESILHSFAQAPNVDIAQKRQTTTRAADRAGIETVDGLGKVSQAVYGDSTWFTQNVCYSNTAVEAGTIWCAPGYSSVQGGTRYTMYYYAAGMAAPSGQGANFYIESYNWTSGTWGTHYSTPLTPGQWVSYTWNGEVTFRSSIYGVNNTTVHFVDGQRRQVTYLNFYTDLPSDHEWDNFEDYQGVTHDDGNWFVSRTEYSWGDPVWGRITKIPVSTSLNNQPNVYITQPSSWRAQFPHYGDLARRGNHLFVAMEGPGGCAVGVHSTSLAAVGYKVLAAPAGGRNHKCGWIAYNPYDGLFYAPLEGHPNTKVFKYQISVSGSTITVTPKGELTLSANISHISGADFSPRGTLWLFAGYATQPLNLYAVDSQNGFVYWRGSFSRWGGPNSDFEAEGVTLWDLTGGQAPGVSGHVHLQILRNDDLSDDQIWMPHLVASDPSAL